jgi:hypothetical protein
MLVIVTSTNFPGLFETDLEGRRIRTTPEGNIVLKWMNYKVPSMKGK